MPPWEARKIDMHRLPGRGRGWVARSDVDAGDLLLAVPWEVALAASLGESSEADLALELLRAVGGAKEAPVPTSGQEARRGFWKEYAADMFPEPPQGAAFWREQWIEKLEWPPVVSEALEYSAQLRAAAEWAGQAAGAPLDRASWAVGAVVSRSFTVEDTERALVPLADLFNHHPQSQATWAAAREVDPTRPYTAWSRSEDGKWFEVRAVRPAVAGEEVTIAYGEESSAEILAVHGFLPEDNEADYVELFSSAEEMLAAVEAITGRPPLHARLSRLEEADASDAPLAVRPGGLDAAGHLVGSLEAALCSEEEFAILTETWSEAAGHLVLALPDILPPERRRAVREEALQVASVVAAGALANMAPAAEDLREAASSPGLASGDPGEQPRVQPDLVAAQYRFGVKKLLADFLSWSSAAIDGKT